MSKEKDNTVGAVTSNAFVSAAKNQGEELVTVKFFKDNGKYKDDICVSVNGRTCIVQRGVPVTIKRKYLWAIENSMAQDEATVELIEAEQAAYDSKAKQLD